MDVKSLLNFRFNKDLYLEKIDEIIDISTEKKIQKNKDKINKIKDDFSTFKSKNPKDIGEIYELFMRVAKTDASNLEKIFNNPAIVRKLAWSLSYKKKNNPTILNSPYYIPALKLINNSFKISMFPALFNALIKNWISVPTGPLQKLISFRIKNNSNKKMKSFQAIKKTSDYYLSPDGIIKLCEKIIDSGKNLNEISEYLGIPESMIHNEYFSEVAETYTKLISRKAHFQQEIDNILDFLIKHNFKDTNIKCIEKIVLKLDRLETSEKLKMKLLNFCFQNIGDPSLSYLWVLSIKSNVNDNDTQNIEKARKTLNNWLAKKFIYIFFDKLAMDSDRKFFWNKYIDYVTNFKIFMNKSTMRYFKEINSEIEPEILNNKLGALSNAGNQSSFVLVIKDYHFVEFSQEGSACYIYRSENENKPDLSWKNVDVNQLKHYQNRQLAVRLNNGYYYFEDEGRVLHNGNWQPKFASWIKNYTGV